MPKKPKRANPVGRGRPTLLTDEAQEKICKSLSLGNFRVAACKFAGVSYRSFKDWLEDGKDDPSSRAGIFRRAVMEAEINAETYAVGSIIAAGKKDAKHFQWWLSHRFPERWADKDRREYRAQLKLQHSGAITNINLSSEEIARLGDDEVRSLEQILLKLGAPAEPEEGSGDSPGSKKPAS